MKVKNSTKKIFIVILGTLVLFLTPTAYAATATMSFNPSSGSQNVGNSFSVDLVIDGKGDAFNAARARVVISSGLQINDVFLGNCNFSFITTPTISNPSFVGAILGGSSQKCTVYTLSLRPTSTGTGLITLLNASIKKHGSAEEILQSVQNASYTLNSATGSSSQEEDTSADSQNQASSIAPESDTGLTTIVLKVVDSANNPISGANVSLSTTESVIPQSGINTTSPTDQQEGVTQAAKPEQFQAITDENGIANIVNVPAGVHTIEVKKDSEKQIASKIVNVPANESVMRLGIQEQKEAINWAQIAIIIIMILVALSVIIIYFRSIIMKLVHKIIDTGKNLFEKTS
jgi:hypothetical protein